LIDVRPEAVEFVLNASGGKRGVKIWTLTDEGKIYAAYFSKEKFCTI
jgi:hypothetical protein